MRGHQLNETGHDQNRAPRHNTTPTDCHTDRLPHRQTATPTDCHTGRPDAPIRHSPTAPPPSGWTLPRPAALALLAAAPVAAQTDVWTTTLTPADFGSGLLSCNNASAIATTKCSTATVLSDDDFTYDSADYSVTTLFLNATAFTFTVDADITAATNALTVVVGSTSLAFADATTQTARTRTWFNPGFSWTAGTAVSIRITGPAPIVPLDWSLKPTGLAQGSQFRLLFLSSTKRDASSTDIADYNTFVQDRAEAGHTDIQGYSAGFRAVGCTADTDARDNTATTGTGVPIYWLNGTKAADDYADFYDGDWDDEANDKNESGTDGPDTSQQANYPFTGCDHDGTEFFSSGDSRALGESFVRVGGPNSSNPDHSPLNGDRSAAAATPRPMYGLSAVFQVLVISPSLTSAVVLADGNTIQLAFSEDLQSTNLPPAAAFTVTAGGSAFTVTGVAAGSTEDVLEITVSPLIGQGQAVVVAYEDPTAGDDAKAIQDTVGNDTPDFTTGSGDVPAVTNNSALTNEVLASWSLTPTGLVAGTKFRLLFLSSTKRDAVSSDIADYNTFVQDRAAAGHADIQAYSGGFGAIGCTAAVDARDNTSTTGTGVPIYWLDGTKVADDYADFYDGSWDDEINDKNESGTDAHDTSQSDNYPITGCANDGTEEFAGATNPRSLGVSTGHVRIGRLNSSGTLQDPIDGNDTARTNLTRPMYGLSAVFEVSSSPSTNPSVPAVISDVAVVPAPRTTGSLRVFWTAPDNTGKPALTGYDVRYSDSGENNWRTVRVDDAASTTLIISGIANSYYDVQVRALNVKYTGPWSSIAEGATNFPPERIYANHPLIPDDLGPGDSFRLLFITEETTDATDTGIHDYHDFSTEGLHAISDPGRLMSAWGVVTLGQSALVSTPGADARQHTDTTWTETDRGVPIYWLNGARVADDYADFYDGVWADEANPTNDVGEPHSLADPAPWTGTDHDGTELFDGAASRAVGQSTVGVGAPGSSASGAGPLKGGTRFAKTEERPLYGLWHLLVVDENLRLVTNFFQPAVGNVSNTRAAVRAQLFTTGPHSSGYGISSIEVEKGSETATFLGTVAIHTTDGDGDPDLADGLHATLSLENTGSSTWTLAAPAGTVLKPSTTYALVFKGDSGTYPGLYTSPADGEDSPADGWSLADALVYYSGSAWVENTDGTSLVIEMIGPLAAATTAVPAAWSLKPTGLNTGDRFRLLFLSSTKRDGTATDIATYNTFIQNLAAAGHTDIRDYSAGFTAIGCTEAVDARDNTSTTYTAEDKGVPIYWLGGAKAADQYEDFYDGSWDDEANDKNESGADAHDTSIQSNFPSTGCNHDGTEAFQAGDSIALGGSDVRLGRPNSTGSGHGPISSDRHRRTDVTFTNPLYGLSAVFRVAAATNNPATGAPTITGTAQVGQTLTAGTTAIMDDDGLTTPGYTYQWIRVATDNTETNIGSATASTYTLVTDDLGTTIKVKVSFTDDASNAETRTSVATAVVAAPPDTTPPTVTGTPSTAASGTQIQIPFNEALQQSNGPLASAFTVTADGSAVRVSAVNLDPSFLAFVGLTVSPLIRQGQAVVVTYTDPTGGNDTNAIQDVAGNDAATFTTGMNSVPAVDNDSTVAPVAPGAPTSLTATAGGSTQIDLSWTAPGDNGGRVITGYKIEISSDAGNAWTTHLADTTNPNTTYAHTGLAASTTRHYRVSAINTIGTGAASNVDDATTGAGTNTAPTASNGEVTATEDMDYPFTAANFNFSDTDAGAALSSVKITSLPASGTGTLAVDGTVIASGALPKAVTKVDIDASKLTYSPPADASGDDYATFQFKVNDGTDDSATASTMTIDVTAVNDAPTVATAIPNQTAPAGTAFNYAFPDTTFSDTDGDTLTYMATKSDDTALPTWLSFDAGTRIFSGTPQAADVATVSVKVTASDGKGGSVSDEFDITVAAAGQSEITLVGNAGQPTGERHTASFQGAVDHAQQFATGPNAAGYTLTKVEFLSNDAQSHTFSAQLCEANNTGGDAVPDPMNCQTLSTTSSFAQGSVVVFTPPAGMTITLAASTRYVVVLSENNSSSAQVAIFATQADNQNGEAGWTLANVFDWKQNGTTWMKQGTGRDALIMDVKGYATTGAGTNTPPTASNGEVTATEDMDYPFTAANFNFSDTDAGAALSSVKITSLPASGTGTLAVDGTVIASGALPKAVTKVDIDASKLTYSPPADASGNDYATFQFKVNDGTDDSTTAYTMTIDVTAVNDAATGKPGITGTAQVGQLLTATVGTIADPDVLPDPFLADANTSFQWVRVTSGTDDDISGETASTYTLATADEGKTIKVKVSFQDGGGGSEGPLTSVATAVVSAPTAPGAPTGLTATASGNTQIDLSWTAPASDGGSAITGYKIEESPNGIDTWTDRVANTADAATTYAHTGLAASTTRHYRVSAINTIGTSSASNIDDATTGAGTLPEVTLVGNAGQPTGERHTASFQGAVDHAQQFTTGPNAAGDTLTKVEFLSNDAQGHTFSAQLCEANNAGEATVPDPMNCQTLSTTSSFAQGSVVVFTPPAGMTITLAASTRYVVVLSENNSPSAVVDILSTQANNQNGETGWTLADVFDWKQSGTTWMKQGSGRDALIMDVKGYATPPLLPPAAVSDVAVVPVRRTTDSLTVSWSAPDNAGKPAITGYDVRYRETGNWTTVRQDAPSTSVIITGLDSSGHYEVEVRALNADGSGPWSSTAEGVPSPPSERVYANHPMILDDLGPGDSFRLLYVTKAAGGRSGMTTATDTGIHDYRDFVSSAVYGLIEAGGLVVDWGPIPVQQVSLLSTPGADARLLTDTTWTSTDRGVPIYWLNGARVADDYADFYDGAWENEDKPRNGSGTLYSPADPAPWTGTDHDGTELFDGAASRAVGQATVGAGAPGSTANNAGPLNGAAAFASSEERPLYGLWPVMVVDENLRLVTNYHQPESASDSNDTRAAVRAQLFTTGPHSSGYGIGEITVWRVPGTIPVPSWAASPSIPRTRLATRTWWTGSTPRSAWRERPGFAGA